MSAIDSHHHVWWIRKHAYHWPPQGRELLNRDFTPDDLKVELDACGIDGSVLVQVLQLDETREFLELQRRHDFIRGVVGWVPLADPKATAQALEELPSRGKLVGVRHLVFNEPDPNWLVQPAVLESLKLLAKAGFAFDSIPVTPPQFDAMLEAARRLPDLNIVLNHLGGPPLPTLGWEPWASQIKAAGELKNVTVKLSIGLHAVVGWRWSTEQAKRYVDRVMEAFGPSRVMAGSNWPPILLGGGFKEVWDGQIELISGYSAAEKAEILGATAERVYRL
jgi:L-fuconolactonase